MDNNTIEVTATHLVLRDGFIKHLEEEEKSSESYSYSGYNSNSYYSGGYNGCNNYCRSSPTYGYNGGTEYNNDRCLCYFYEWSDLTSQPRIFRKGEDFFKFLDDCKIKYEKEDVKQINTYFYFYATCKKGKAELLLTRNFKTLETIYNKFAIEYDND